MVQNFMRAAAMVLAISIADSAMANGAGGICVTGDIGIEGVSPGTCFSEGEIDALMDAPVRQGENDAAPLQMTHPDDMDKRVPVRTCRRYLGYKAEDYYALSGADIAAEGWYERACGALRVLAAARPASRSFLARPDTGLSDVSLLTVRMLPVSAEASRKEVAALSKAGMTIADLVAEGAVIVHTSRRMELDLTYAGNRARYRELARADLNADDLDDVLVFMGVHAEAGSLAWYDTIGLTRRRPRGLVETVQTPDEAN